VTESDADKWRWGPKHEPTPPSRPPRRRARRAAIWLVGFGVCFVAIWVVGANNDLNGASKARLIGAAVFLIGWFLWVVLHEIQAQREWEREWKQADWDEPHWDRLGQLNDEPWEGMADQPASPTNHSSPDA
jgi:hypothetical protein